MDSVIAMLLNCSIILLLSFFSISLPFIPLLVRQFLKTILPVASKYDVARSANSILYKGFRNMGWFSSFDSLAPAMANYRSFSGCVRGLAICFLFNSYKKHADAYAGRNSFGSYVSVVGGISCFFFFPVPSSQWFLLFQLVKTSVLQVLRLLNRIQRHLNGWSEALHHLILLRNFQLSLEDPFVQLKY